MFDYKSAKERMRSEGKGKVRKEVLEEILRIKSEIENNNNRNEQSKLTNKNIIYDIRLLRCVCNYIANQTDRSLQQLYQDFYG